MFVSGVVSFRLFSLSELARHATCQTLEELHEVGGILKSQIIAYLLDVKRCVLQLSLGFEHDAVVDDPEWSAVGAILVATSHNFAIVKATHTYSLKRRRTWKK